MTRSNEEDPFRSVESDNVRTPPPYVEGRSQVLTGDTGRQGPSGRRILLVLVLSLIATALVWAAGGILHWW